MDTIKDITPEGSLVPIYLQEPSEEELAQRQKEHEQVKKCWFN